MAEMVLGLTHTGHAAGQGVLSLFYLVWDVDRSRRAGQHCKKAEDREAKEISFN